VKPPTPGKQRPPLVILIRHGQTTHNKLGLFTGWEDASLAKEGIAEAKRAGQLLRAHGFAVDAVYTSWLSRAIETAWLALQELDALWVPIIKSWRLNERMYGALTGLSKKAILGEHGEARFKQWRFDTASGSDLRLWDDGVGARRWRPRNATSPRRRRDHEER
jgi:2,3-bisphosphoglycerate-dependent phosphoglycerate mutase